MVIRQIGIVVRLQDRSIQHYSYDIGANGVQSLQGSRGDFAIRPPTINDQQHGGSGLCDEARVGYREDRRRIEDNPIEVGSNRLNDFVKALRSEQVSRIS